MKLLFLQFLYLYTVFTVYADIYKPQQLRPYTRVVIFFDLDKVVLDEKSGLGKLWAALLAIPLKKSLPILLRQRKKLMKLVQEARHDGQKLKGLKANLDFIVEAEPSLKPYRAMLIDKLNGVKPRKKMISFLNALRTVGTPLIVATNNDYESLRIKISKLNKKLHKEQISPFIYDAAFCAGSCPELIENKAPDGMPADFVYGGKDTDEYFRKFFEFVETELGYDKDTTLFIYIDDLEKNITRARHVAERENVQLYAVHRNKSDKKIINEMRLLFSSVPIYGLAGV